MVITAILGHVQSQIRAQNRPYLILLSAVKQELLAIIQVVFLDLLLVVQAHKEPKITHQQQNLESQRINYLD